MKKKLITIFLTLAAALCLCLGLAGCTLSGKKSNSGNSEQGDHVHTYTVDNVCSVCGKKWEYTEEGLKYHYLSEYDGYEVELPTLANNVVIPYGHQGKYVISIGRCAFDGNYSLESIEIPDSVTSIGDYAFRNCLSLKNVTIGNGVTSIGYGAFPNCSSLESIDVAPNNPVYHSDGNCLIETESKTLIAGCNTSTIPSDGSVTSIGEWAFTSRSSLERIEIPDGVTSIGKDAFEGTAYYNDQSHWDSSGVLYIGNHLIEAKNTLSGSYTIRAGTKTIADYAFSGCKSLEGIEIPNSVTSIGSRAFSGCSLKSVTIPDSVTFIEKRTFYYCSSLESIDIPDSVTEIGDGAFSDCSSLTSIEIPDSVIEIGGGAFEGCSLLESIEIPDSVTSIGYGAFYNCSSLTSINIPDSVTSIGEEAFYGCRSLESIFVAERNEYFSSQDGILYNKAKTEFIYIPGAIKGAVTIPNGVTAIGYQAFYNCSSLESINIPDSVTSIGYQAFYNCSSLGNVIWNAEIVNVIWYDENCTDAEYFPSPIFKNCTNLKTVTFGTNVQTIPAYAFYGCSSLTSVTIGSGVTSIGNSAFYKCSLLANIEIPEGVTSIGEDAFEGTAYYNDQSHWDASGVLYISNHLIKAKDTIMGSYTIRANTKTIAGGAFEGCSSLESINIPDSVTSIGYGAFYNCSSLASIEIPDSVTSIEEFAFSHCSSLTSITIPESVTSIGRYAFRDCRSLESIFVAEGNENYSSQDGILYNKAKTEFIGIPKAIKGAVTIPNGVTSIGNNAFSGCSSLESIKIPDSVTSIGYQAFEDCDSLESIEIPESVTLIGDGAFEGCSSLESINIPDSVTSIGYGAFYNCSSLTSINIPDSVTSIGSVAFYYCWSLMDIHYKGSYEEWKKICDNAISISTRAVIHCTDGDYDTDGNKVE